MKEKTYKAILDMAQWAENNMINGSYLKARSTLGIGETDPSPMLGLEFATVELIGLPNQIAVLKAKFYNASLVVAQVCSFLAENISDLHKIMPPPPVDIEDILSELMNDMEEAMGGRCNCKSCQQEDEEGDDEEDEEDDDEKKLPRIFRLPTNKLH